LVQEQKDTLLSFFDCIVFRQEMDDKYYEAICGLHNDHWYTQWRKYRKITPEIKQFWKEEYCVKDVKTIARMMEDEAYPVSFGSWDKLNEMGEKLVDVMYIDQLSRTQELQEVQGSEEAQWRTFRDTRLLISSIYTGIRAAPLEKRWIDIED